MKLVRGISLFIVCLGLFIIGCFLGAEFQAFFYPGNGSKEKVSVSDTGPGYVCADTIWEIHEIYLDTNHEVIPSLGYIRSETVPAKFLGMGLKELSEEINQMNLSPSLNDLKNGLENISLNAFSDKKVEIYKYYETKKEQPKPEFYYLAIFQNHVIVYENDGETVFMNTNIRADHLPEEVLNDLLQRKMIPSEKELYAFLESYSS